jgi:hypothetical protein
VETITLAQAIAKVALTTKNQATLDRLSLTQFDLWFEIGRSVYEGKFTVKALEIATETSCATQVTKVRKVLKAMDKSKAYRNMIDNDKFTSLELAYVTACKYVGKVKTSRAKVTPLQAKTTWAMTKTIAELNLLEKAIKAAKIAKAK